jgi:hypothetical protein
MALVWQSLPSCSTTKPRERFARRAERLGKSQSLVVREAVAEYAGACRRLTEAERRRMLGAIDA